MFNTFPIDLLWRFCQWLKHRRLSKGRCCIFMVALRIHVEKRKGLHHCGNYCTHFSSSWVIIQEDPVGDAVIWTFPAVLSVALSLNSCQYVRGIGRVIQNLKDYKSQDILVEKGWKMCQNIGPSNYPLWINHQIGDKFLWVIRLTDRRLALHRILSNQWFGIIGWSVIRGWPLRQALPHTTQCAQAFLCPGWQKLRNRSTGEMSKIQPFTFYNFFSLLV